jgi:UDP-N-acetylmuramate--alanine ligase
MNLREMFAEPAGKKFYLIGIKGQGMTALAEILKSRGALITGSDIEDKFYTDGILKKAGIKFFEGFDREHISDNISAAIYSAAYNKNTNPELRQVFDSGIPAVTYPEALGFLSGICDFSGVAGVHGKTTTTALAGSLVKNLDLPVTVLAGSEVPAFGGRSVLIKGGKYMIAETCEYRRHFLHYKPMRIVLTSVELDHTDYFRDLDDIISAFVSYADLLPEGGSFIYNADDKGASAVYERIKGGGRDLKFISYGTGKNCDFIIENTVTGRGLTVFDIKGSAENIALKVPGLHIVFNSAAAFALVCDICGTRTDKNFIDSLKEGISSFTGTKRRSEIIGEAKGILFMDDYAHHPTAIKKTLKGLREFYPGRRIIVDFMSHTYSRTKTLLKEFGTCFDEADIVILNKIYSSAREKKPDEFSGENLYNEISRNHKEVIYISEPMEASDYLQSRLRENDLFITMGAGDNWKLCNLVYKQLSN